LSSRLTEVFGQWKRTFTEGKLPLVVVLYGDSDTLIKRAVQTFLDHLFSGGGKALNYQTFDGRTTLPSQWVVAVRTAPMMARQRVVHVTDADGPLGGDGKAVPDDDLTGIIDYLTNSKGKGVLILTARTVNTKGKVVAAVDQAGGLHPFTTFEKQHDVNQFIRTLFRRRKISIDEAAVSYLADALGRSAEAIISEVDKLSEYADQGRGITLHDAQDMVQRLQGHTIFELNRALVQKDAVKSLTLLDRMYNNLLDSKRKVSASGLPLLVLSTCIEGEFRKLTVAKQFEQTNDTKGLAAALKLRQNVAGIIMANARRFTSEELERTLSHIHRVDKRLKSTPLSSKLLLEELILSICAKGR
jgi:DNA polymerase III delta subunit